MKVSLDWLKQYVSAAMPPAELADRLTMAGLEVEGIIHRFDYLETVVVGRITEVHPHPNADRLSVCRVDAGGRMRSVVCGAPNAKPGVAAPLALPGTLLPGGLHVTETAIRGVISEGMLCSRTELELGSDASGIMELEPDAEAGQSLAEILNLPDTVFEIGLTPNRPDCLSILGVAREVAAMTGDRMTPPDITLPAAQGDIHEITSVTIEAPDLCPRYAAIMLEDIAVAPSPEWLQNRLRSVDLKPINNIVDITNFVMMETGQPLHAFDFDLLAGHRIVVKTAAEGETFTTLDGRKRILSSETLMICDGEKPVAVAGIMGGENSEINENTRRVLIESACFNPVSVRRTAKRLGLATDASHRFERGVDPDGTVRAAKRAARLMAKIGGGTLVGGLIDVHPRPGKKNTIRLSTAGTNRHLGTALDTREIARCLESIEFKVDAAGSGELMVTPPSFRVDVSRPEDLMEEVARLWGYNRIQTTFPKITAGTMLPLQGLPVKDRIKDQMAGSGFSEVISYSFTDASACDRLGLADNDPRRRVLDIINPLSEDQAVMRTTLVSGLLETMKRNIHRQNRNLKLFELGKIFLSRGPDRQPEEIEKISALWTGSRYEPAWHAQPEACDFYDLKGVVENLLEALHIAPAVFDRVPDDTCVYTQPGHTARITAEKTVLGLIGEVSPKVLERFDLKQPAFVFDLDVAALSALFRDAAAVSPIPRFPAVERDVTLIVDKHVQAGDIVQKAASLGEALMENVRIFDLYRGEPIPAGKKSISIRFTYRSPEETLSDKQVNHLHQQISERLISAFDASLPV